MFDLGFQELIVIFIVALLVFGPKKLPELGRTLGKGIRELKKAVSEMRSEMDRETLIGNPPAGEKDADSSGGKDSAGPEGEEAAMIPPDGKEAKR